MIIDAQTQKVIKILEAITGGICTYYGIRLIFYIIKLAPLLAL